ncbi:MAG: hypothetical protein L0Z53_19260 [Acidobacteriales bacterium]|nr:hypothetical protein [Terriglobales bacterium]
MPLSSNLSLAINWNHTSALDLSTVTDNATVDYGDSLASGTGLDQCDLKFHDRRTLSATTEELDLAGSLTDAFGQTITFAKVKGILIHNRNTTAGQTLIIGGAAANAFPLFTDVTDKYTLGPDGKFLAWEPSLAGKAVTAGTGDKLKLDAGANTVTYDIVIFGTSA